jgi:hypothetical protein
MYITITCSCCGEHRRLTNKRVSYTVKAIKDGWGSCGSALYCPRCSRTWQERNTKPMADESNTFWLIASHFIRATRIEED